MTSPDGEIHASPQIGVSNTEVQQAYSCELAWLYGYHPELNLQPNSMGPARTRGIEGHKALEVFYKNLRETEDFDKSAQEALNHIQGCRVEILSHGDFADLRMLEIYNYLFDILGKYFEYYQDDVENWEILEVEGFHAMEWENEHDFYLPSRIDMVIYQKSGKFKGETSPLDNKFVQDFWDFNKLRMNSQMPLYQRALRIARFAGKPDPIVKRSIVNQIRTRPMKNPGMMDLFKRNFFEYSNDRVERVFENHMRSAVKLAYLKRIPLDEAREQVRAALGSQACAFCDFKDLCDTEFDGGDIRKTIAAEFRKSEYGYPPLEAMRNERGHIS